MRKEDGLQTVEEERNILQPREGELDWSHLVYEQPSETRYCRKVEGKIQVTRRGRRRRQLLDDIKETRGYCKLKKEALERILWRTRFGRGYGLVRRTTE